MALPWIFFLLIPFLLEDGTDRNLPDRPAPIRLLIVTGVDHPAHRWRETAPVLRDLLETDGRCSARIVEDPEVLGTDILGDYDVVVLHFRNEKPLVREASARANLSRFVDEGHGLVLVHFACGAFGDWSGYGDLAGMVWDLKNTHDPRGRFTVHLADRSHPITSGLDDFEADDELYIGLSPRRRVDVLATARSRVTGRDHPMAFAFTRGRGRIFHTPLGHDVAALKVPAVGRLIRRGCLWTSGRMP